VGVAIPEAFLPSELGWHCLVVGDAGRPARDENLVFVHRMADGLPEGAGARLAHLCVGRFVPPTAPTDGAAIAQALLAALDRVIPGVESIAVHQWVAPASALAELWGRPMAAVRYAADSRAWMGRRGLAHRVGWPGLLAVGEWTYPGRLFSDVVEGAIHVADLIAARGRSNA
jgi:phytoene dehydrogenase-like protein